jgi:hypothetical protein
MKGGDTDYLGFIRPTCDALVTDIEPGRTILELVNLTARPRDVVVQFGAYAEHDFTTVETSGQSATVDSSHLRVSLPPKTSARLDAGTDRYANDPTYEIPIE